MSAQVRPVNTSDHRYIIALGVHVPYMPLVLSRILVDPQHLQACVDFVSSTRETTVHSSPSSTEFQGSLCRTACLLSHYHHTIEFATIFSMFVSDCFEEANTGHTHAISPMECCNAGSGDTALENQEAVENSTSSRRGRYSQWQERSCLSNIHRTTLNVLSMQGSTYGK